MSTFRFFLIGLVLLCSCDKDELNKSTPPTSPIEKPSFNASELARALGQSFWQFKLPKDLPSGASFSLEITDQSGKVLKKSPPIQLQSERQFKLFLGTEQNELRFSFVAASSTLQGTMPLNTKGAIKSVLREGEIVSFADELIIFKFKNDQERHLSFVQN